MSSNNNETSISPLGITIWLLASMFFLYEFFLRTFVGTLAQQLLPDLHLTAASFALIGSAYYFAYAIMQLPVGMIASRFGIKNTLLFAMIVCTISALLFSHAHHFTDALIARILMGLGSSFAFICLLVISTVWFPQRHFGFLIGAAQFVGTMGPLLAAGPLAWALTKAHGDWRMLLNQIGFIGLGLTFLVFLFVKEKSTASRPTIIFLKKPESAFTLLRRLFSNPQAWFVALYSATTYCPIAFLGAFWGTSFLQSHGFTQGGAANILSIAWFGYAVSCLIIGIISDTIRRRKPILIASAAIGLIATSAITYIPTLSASIYSLLFLCIGLAASGQSIGFATIAEHVDISIKPTALGLNNAVMMMFSVIIPPVSGYLIGLSAHGHAPTFEPGDFTVGFSIMPILYLAAFIISSFFVKETFCRPQKEIIMLNTDESPASI